MRGGVGVTVWICRVVGMGYYAKGVKMRRVGEWGGHNQHGMPLVKLAFPLYLEICFILRQFCFSRVTSSKFVVR